MFKYWSRTKLGKVNNLVILFLFDSFMCGSALTFTLYNDLLAKGKQIKAVLTPHPPLKKRRIFIAVYNL